MSISRIFATQAEHDPERVVAVADEGELTAAALEREGTRWARALLDAGVPRDGLVAVSLPNGLALVAACVGIWKAGATPLPISPRLAPDERDAVLAVARPAAAIGVAAGGGTPSWPQGRDAASPDPGSAVAADAAGSASAPPESAGPESPLPDLWAASWKAVTSSGSTGRPKVVLATSPALLDPEAPVAPFLPLRTTQLVAGPMTHSAVFTYAFRGLMTGHRLVILPRFDERRWIEAVARHRVGWALLVPTMMHRLLRLPAAERDAARLASIESLLHLGAPCAPELKRAFLEWVGPERLVEVYAGSESNGLTMIRGDEWLARPGSAGRPIGGTELQVRRPDGGVAAAGERGQIWMRRGTAPSYRYLGAASQRDREGWDTLGDIGRLDADGYLYVEDRVDDVINRGGEKFSPAELEHVLERHPAVRGAVAFGAPDAEYGQHAEAVVDVAEAEVTASDLLAFAAERLPAARRPAVIRLVRHPLRDDAGKVRRSRLASGG